MVTLCVYARTVHLSFDVGCPSAHASSRSWAGGPPTAVAVAGPIQTAPKMFSGLTVTPQSSEERGDDDTFSGFDVGEKPAEPSSAVSSFAFMTVAPAAEQPLPPSPSPAASAFIFLNPGGESEPAAANLVQHSLDQLSGLISRKADFLIDRLAELGARYRFACHWTFPQSVASRTVSIEKKSVNIKRMRQSF